MLCVKKKGCEVVIYWDATHWWSFSRNGPNSDTTSSCPNLSILFWNYLCWESCIELGMFGGGGRIKWNIIYDFEIFYIKKYLCTLFF